MPLKYMRNNKTGNYLIYLEKGNKLYINNTEYVADMTDDRWKNLDKIL